MEHGSAIVPSWKSLTSRFGTKYCAFGFGMVLTAALGLRDGAGGNVIQELANQVADVMQADMEEEFARGSTQLPPGADGAFCEAAMGLAERVREAERHCTAVAVLFGVALHAAAQSDAVEAVVDGCPQKPHCQGQSEQGGGAPCYEATLAAGRGRAVGGLSDGDMLQNTVRTTCVCQHMQVEKSGKKILVLFSMISFLIAEPVNQT